MFHKNVSSIWRYNNDDDFEQSPSNVETKNSDFLTQEQHLKIIKYWKKNYKKCTNLLPCVRF